MSVFIFTFICHAEGQFYCLGVSWCHMFCVCFRKTVSVVCHADVTGRRCQCNCNNVLLNMKCQ